MKPVILSWSGGKDSALALQALRRDPSVRVTALLTTITTEYDRVSVHGVRRTLLHEQARSLGLPVFEARIAPRSSNEDYNAAFRSALDDVRSQFPDVKHIAFGDLFLQDVRDYREQQLEGTGWTPLFPIWGEETGALARRFIADGFEARLVCVDTTQLDAGFAGRPFDVQLLTDLPATCDPCGERGEFHTFVAGGPGFERPILYECGESVSRDGRFMFCDLLGKGG